MGKRLSILAVLAGAFLCSIALAAPTISNISDNTSDYPNGAVPVYEKYELTFNIGNVGTAFSDYNPFNPNITALGSQYYNKRGILVDGILTTPSGDTITHPAFWYDDGVWKFRFAPTTAGTWKVKIRAQDSSGTSYSTERTFKATNEGAGPGFIKVNPRDPRLFEFSNGEPFYPIGCDISGYGGSFGVAWEAAYPKMKATGANYTRFFFTSLNIEPYCVGSDKSTPKALNNYNMSRAKTLDDMFDVAHENGVYVEWVLDDWTYLKDSSNQYIRASGRDAPCADVEDFFTLSTAKEIYKRKLRYWLARWGYSTNLMCLEFINELGGETSVSPAWHIEMGDYIHSYSWQLHLASSSNGSGELRTGGGIPWTDDAMDYVNYHDYAKYTGDWSIKSNYEFEPLGSKLEYPWQDTAVWADRLARMHFKRYKWNKPLSFTEFGLIFRRPGDSSFPDWTLAYEEDTDARHVKDCIWAGMLANLSITHWKLDYMLGKYGGGDKFHIFAPLANFVSGESFEGLTQETTYSVSDPINSSPKVTCSNGNVMVVSMHGSSKAYLYVKNLTDTWFYHYYYGQSSDRYADSSSIPTPKTQSATIKVYGMTPGTYTVEKWSTTETDRTKQILSTESITVASDGIATVSVSNLDCDIAVKIKPTGGGSPNISLTIKADQTLITPGDIITYTVTYTNMGSGSASDVVISAPIPENTTYVSASSGGTYNATAGRVQWTLAGLSTGASGTVTFKVEVH